MSQPAASAADPAIAAQLAGYDASHDVALLRDAADAAARDDGEVIADPEAALGRATARVANWIAILSRFRRDIDPNFDPAHPPTVAIIPPGKFGDQYPPGVDPADVTDPEMRRNYIVALEKNRERVALYTTALKLNEIHDTIRERAAASVRDAHATLGVPSAAIELMLRDADIMQADRDALRAAVRP